MELYQEIMRLMAELTESVKRLRNNGVKLAEAEYNYKTSLSKESLKLRADDMPVTLIDKVVYGVPEVAQKRLERDIAEANYKANEEYINATKKKLGILQEQMRLEYGVAGKGDI